ncbi:MAG TPA: hypothetical protein VJI12_00550 [archaeon]|nr:hypothetical protein [archaeon]
MTCINCGLDSAATAELSGVTASFCCSHIPSGAKIKMFAPC